MEPLRLQGPDLSMKSKALLLRIFRNGYRLNPHFGVCIRLLGGVDKVAVLRDGRLELFGPTADVTAQLAWAAEGAPTAPGRPAVADG